MKKVDLKRKTNRGNRIFTFLYRDNIYQKRDRTNPFQSLLLGFQMSWMVGCLWNSWSAHVSTQYSDFHSWKRGSPFPFNITHTESAVKHCLHLSTDEHSLDVDCLASSSLCWRVARKKSLFLLCKWRQGKCCRYHSVLLPLFLEGTNVDGIGNSVIAVKLAIVMCQNSPRPKPPFWLSELLNLLCRRAIERLNLFIVCGTDYPGLNFRLVSSKEESELTEELLAWRESESLRKCSGYPANDLHRIFYT